MTNARQWSVNGHLGQALDALGEHWIGWSFPPPARAMADTQWRPDSSDDYCSRCGDSVGEGEATPQGCGTCREGAELAGGLGDGIIRLGAYVDPLRNWIRAIKFRGWDEMAERLGEMLAAALRERSTSTVCVGAIGGNGAQSDQHRPRSMVDLARTLIVPMPMPWQRRLYRGSDHAAAIARSVSNTLAVPMFRILARSNHAPQVSLTPTDRKRSGGRGLRLSQRIGWNGVRRGAAAWPLDGLDVVLVDDVRTTGATLKAAVRLLRTLRPRMVVCAVLAVSDSRARQQRRGTETRA